MDSLRLASLALVLVASAGTTGCGYRRCHARYLYVPVRPRAVVVAPPAAPAYYAPPAPVAPPPATYATYGQQPIIVRTQGPGTTIIVVNPPSDRPAVGIVQGAPPGYGPPPPAARPIYVAPPPAAPAAPPPPAAPEGSGGWTDGE